MILQQVPIVLMLVGLTAYVVLGGADFGAGIWPLAARRSPLARRIADHAHHAMAPVWEANHVWLIFVLVVCWTAYPVAFASIASTLAVPLFIAAVGIILRGTTYALRYEAASAREQALVGAVFVASSMLTPFALGAAAGAIASGRVPVGNAAGDLVTSWLNPTSIVVGALTVAVSAYLAACYLAADATRLGDRDVAEWFRRSALWAALVTGALALAGLVVVHGDAPLVWSGLRRGAGAAAVIVSALAGIGTIVLVSRRRYEPARVSAAAAVAAVVAGWAFAQRPFLLPPSLTVSQAAAGHGTLVAIVIATAIGVLILAPSLVLLYALVLRGRFDAGEPRPHAAAAPAPRRHEPSGRRSLVIAVASGVVGTVLLVLVDDAWAMAIGVVALAVFCVAGFAAIATPGFLEGDGPAEPL